MKLKFPNVVLLLFLFTSVIGCGREKLPYEVVAVRGTVTSNGQPVPKGVRLQFAPVNGEGRPSDAIVGDDGKFKAIYTRSVEGVQVGKVTLTLSWSGDSAKVPADAAEILKKHRGGIPLEITKPDKEFKIELK